MSLYIQTVSIIGGILTPVIVILVLSIVVQSIKGFRESLEYRRKILEKEDVFDSEAEFYEVPNPTMVGVRLKKDDKVIWDGAIYKLDGPVHRSGGISR